MMAQYKNIKSQYPDAILFFRLGDFYEMFDEEAVEVSRLLNLTLTHRAGRPMCGIPHHAMKIYVARLLRHGKRVAVCEQVTLPTGKGITDRKVIEVITPGTTVEDAYLDKTVNNFTACLVPPQKGAPAKDAQKVAFAWLDVSTAVFQVCTWNVDQNAEEFAKAISRVSPSELLLPKSLQNNAAFAPVLELAGENTMISYFPDWQFSKETAYKTLLEHFKTANLNAFSLSEQSPEIVPAGFVLDYATKNAGTRLNQINNLKVFRDDRFLAMDSASRKNLEITLNLQDGGTQYTLFEVLNHTATPMGARLLRSHLFLPLTDVDQINRRQNEVQFFIENQNKAQTIYKLLSAVSDIERLSSRIGMDRAHGKDLQALRTSLLRYIEMRECCPDFSLFKEDVQNAKTVADLINRAILEEPSIVLTEGKLIARGWNEELDHIHKVQNDFSEILAEYLEEEKQKTGISSLKIKYNNQSGYYLEVSKSNLHLVPDYFVRRRSYITGERYTSPKLEELERELLSASEKIVELERSLFIDFRNQLKPFIPSLFAYAAEIAALDLRVSHSFCASNFHWVRPLVDNSASFNIEQGRHPVVEQHLPQGAFVANSTNLSQNPFALITGPNMAGKSTYLRQNALIALLAQIGSFVPAKSAHIGVVDKIFCRVGASDNLARGESTFLVEMAETANILRAATEKSLVIMDEVGRGTSTEDGLSIAWAVSEHLLNKIKCKTLFATHYHELTRLQHSNLQLLCLEVLENDGEVVFLKRIKEGASQNSYGLHVATLAGVPAEVVKRAQNLLTILQKNAQNQQESLAANSVQLAESAGSANMASNCKEKAQNLQNPQGEETENFSNTENASPQVQLVENFENFEDFARQQKTSFSAPGLFSDEELILDEILSINPEEITPLQALQKLSAWKMALQGK